MTNEMTGKEEESILAALEKKAIWQPWETDVYALRVR